MYRLDRRRGALDVLTSNLPAAPANSVVVDPQDAKRSTWPRMRESISTTADFELRACGVELLVGLWKRAAGGAGGGGSAPLRQRLRCNVLVAATYGRGIWQIPLWTAAGRIDDGDRDSVATDLCEPGVWTTSNAQTVT